MRRTRIKGIVAASVAALGLTALAITSAQAAGSGGDEDSSHQPAPTVPGDPGEMPPGVAVQKNEDGSVDIKGLSQEEVDSIEGWEPVQPSE